MYPTNQELQDFRFDIAQHSFLIEGLNDGYDALVHPYTGGAYASELVNGIGYANAWSIWGAIRNGIARREASRMRTRAYDNLLMEA